MTIPTFKQWLATAQYHEDADGQRLAYWQAGSGPAMLCLHGFPSSSYDWHRIWPNLSARFSVLAIDLLGYGCSDKPAHADYRTPAQARRVLSLLARLGVQEFHLLAHDYGDTVAQELLTQVAPRSVVLLNGGLYPEMHRPTLMQRLLASRLGPLLVRAMNQRAFDRSFAKVLGPAAQGDQQFFAETWALLERGGGVARVPRLLGYLAERRRERSRWVPALEQARMPIRLINGNLDPVSGKHLADYYRSRVPSADVVDLPEVGHYPQIEAPEAVWQACDSFWRGLGGSNS